MALRKIAHFHLKQSKTFISPTNSLRKKKLKDDKMVFIYFISDTYEIILTVHNTNRHCLCKINPHSIKLWLCLRKKQQAKCQKTPKNGVSLEITSETGQNSPALQNTVFWSF